jgi:S1-C subfamily serine protease
VTVVDVIVVAFVAASMVHGLWLGAAIQVLSFGGFLGGLLAGAAAAPTVAARFDDPATSRLVAVAVVFGGAVVVGTVGRLVGVRLWGALRRLRLGSLDAALGAVVAAASAALLSWLAASMLATASRPVAEAVQRSVVLQTINAALPPAPEVFARVQGLLEDRGMPPVFVGIPPAPAEPLPPPADPDVRAALDHAAPATLVVSGTGCPLAQQGSGFVAAPDLVVTNAHVVAGSSRTAVMVDGQARAAVPVLYDPDLDVAVLRVAGLGIEPLPVLREEVDRGTVAAAVGYPLAGPLSAEPAVVLRRLEATGRDIHYQRMVSRPVYELQARLQPGNSGGPVVDPQGRVIGLVFSRSTADPGVGYAITSPAVAAHVDAASAAVDPVGLGSCLQP